LWLIHLGGLVALNLELSTQFYKGNESKKWPLFRARVFWIEKDLSTLIGRCDKSIAMRQIAFMTPGDVELDVASFMDGVSPNSSVKHPVAEATNTIRLAHRRLVLLMHWIK